MNRVIIAEKDEQTRTAVKELLTFAKYQVSEAPNGKEAMKLALQTPPDLFVASSGCEGLDGLGLLHIIRKNETLKNVPFILLTDKADREEMRNAVKSGVCDYLEKPVAESEFIRSVENCIEKASVRKRATFETVNELLQTVNDLIGVNDDEREQKFFKPKDLIYIRNSRAAYLFYILKGKVKTYHESDSGKKLITDVFSEGDFFGYNPLFLERPYMETAEALTDTEVVLIPKEIFLHSIHFDEQITREFLKLVAGDVLKRERQLLGAVYNSVRKRVADGLLELSAKMCPKHNLNSFFKIARTDLAQKIGIAKESLIRTLADFKNEKMIAMEGKTIAIIDYEKLKGIDA